jgi:uncharacterized protein DUF2188
MPRVTIGPKTAGGWQVTGDDQTFRTQADAEQAARRKLASTGGGELVVEGRDKRVRLQNTIGRPDPRRSKGYAIALRRHRCVGRVTASTAGPQHSDAMNCRVASPPDDRAGPACGLLRDPRRHTRLLGRSRPASRRGECRDRRVGDRRRAPQRRANGAGLG